MLNMKNNLLTELKMVILKYFYFYLLQSGMKDVAKLHSFWK